MAQALSKKTLTLPSDVSVPSITLMEFAHQKVSKHLGLDEFFSIWRSLSQIVSTSLLKGRGVRFENFGTFSFNQRGDLTFILSTQFSQTNRVAQRNSVPVLKSTVSNSKFNVAQLANESDKPSRLITHTLDSVFSTLSDYIRQDCSVALSFQPLGSFVCANQEVYFKYSPEFHLRMANALKGIKEPTRDVGKEIAAKKSLVATNAKSSNSRSNSRSNSNSNYRTPENNIFPPPPPSSHSIVSNNFNNNNNNIFPSPLTPPTPRLSKTSQLRLRAQALKNANPNLSTLHPHHKSKGAREIASNARQAELEATVTMLRNKIIVRGGPYGIRGLGRLLKAADDDDNGELSKIEMKNCFVDMGIKVSPQQLADVFVYFDKDGSKSVSFDEFMDGIRGQLSEYRLHVLDQAFDHIDESRDGDISITEMKKKFSCSTHPSIIDKTATKEQVTKEFLSQWDKARADGKVDRDDFIDYYADISSSIPSDEDFIFFLSETWGFEFEDPLASEFQSMMDGNAEGDDFQALEGSASQVDDQYTDDIKLVGEIMYTPPKTFEELITFTGASQISACPSISLAQFGMVLGKHGVSKSRVPEVLDSLKQSLNSNGNGNGNGSSMIEIEKLYFLLERRFGGGPQGGSIIDIVKCKLLQRAGSDGLRAVVRVMKMMDDDGSRTLSKNELKNGLSDWGLDLNYSEIDALFTFFDRDNSGTISFDEFVKGMRGPMSDRRKNLVQLAFKVVDKTGDGQVTVEDLKGVYDCSQHEGVVAGDISEEEVLAHFVDTWDQGEKDGIVTLDEFIEYYADVGASIDGDDYFELMIRNAWHISGGKGAHENSTNLRVLCLYKDKTEEVVVVQSDMGLGDERAKNYKDKVMAQLKKEEAGEKHGGLVDIDLSGSGFEKDKKKKAELEAKKKKKKN